MYISEHDKALIRQAIERQLQAFQEDDAVSAFAFASPTIQQQFDTPENFMMMVKKGYQAVYCPRSVIFRGFTMVDDYPAQVLILMDQEGNLLQAVYVMQCQSDRSWRIHGCFLVPLDKQVI
ncbi:MAG: hypothetical protein Tsb0014_24180 [Pleurocapsa sp.]